MVIRTVNASQTMILLRIPMLNQIKRQQPILMLQKVILKKRINYFFLWHYKFFREINVNLHFRKRRRRRRRNSRWWRRRRWLNFIIISLAAYQNVNKQLKSAVHMIIFFWIIATRINYTFRPGIKTSRQIKETHIYYKK